MAWLTVRHHRAATGRHWRTGVFLRHPIAAYDSEALLELAAPAQLAVEVRAPSPGPVLPRAVRQHRDTHQEPLARPELSAVHPLPQPSLRTGRGALICCPWRTCSLYREEGETRYLCFQCRIRHDVSALLTGFPGTSSATGR